MAKDLSKDIDVKIITSAPVFDLITLYESAGWWGDSYTQQPGFLNNIVRDSAFFAGAFYKKRLIGMGRALSDMASDAYIQDVAVLEKFKGQGIGKKIIQILITELKKNGVDWIGLIAEPGTASFYERLGFEQLKGHIPLKYIGSRQDPK